MPPLLRRSLSIIARCLPLRLPARRSGLKFASQKSAEEQEGRKHSQTACPRTWVEIRSFMTVAIIKDGHARIIIMRPETISTRGGYIFADCFSSNLILLAFGWRTIHISKAIPAQPKWIQSLM